MATTIAHHELKRLEAEWEVFAFYLEGNDSREGTFAYLTAFAWARENMNRRKEIEHVINILS